MPPGFTSRLVAPGDAGRAAGDVPEERETDRIGTSTFDGP